ncbi:MAG: PVC-type heme-binding CxxCH protein [Verrucomicrobiota bacterium]
MHSSFLSHGFIRLLFGVLLGVGGAGLAVLGGQQQLVPNNPFYVDKDFPKLTTPQWVGEEGVDAVVILAIDDLRTTQKYEDYLRPILNRLKKIDGRAPVSIYCNSLDPNEPRFQIWLKEGLSLEVHTLSHPCPLLAKGDFPAAQNTFFGGVDLLNRIPNNRTVAYRMPCCDSINSPSPRFYSEIFPYTSEEGGFLEIDSSVVCLLTSDDSELPGNLVLDAEGKERFTKYVPFPSFTTTIENYPYPYVINDVCWEFPALAPSDWEAQNLHGVNNETTVEDWKRALDLTVKKQGVFTWVFHPHGWIRNDQVNEFIDYADETFGRRVLFLTFKEAAERLREHLLSGHGLRRPDGKDAGNRLVDINRDGYLDVVLGGQEKGTVRIWNEELGSYMDQASPLPVQTDGAHATGLKHGVFWKDGPTAWFYRDDKGEGAWLSEADELITLGSLISELRCKGRAVPTVLQNNTDGVLVHDVDHDGVDELIVGYPGQQGVLKWRQDRKTWEEMSYFWPDDVTLVDDQGRDMGVRLVDINSDGWLDLIQSDETRYSAYIFIPEWVLGFQAGWSRLIMEGKRSDEDAIPAFVRAGAHRDNGAWFAKGHVWVQNEDTAHLPDLVQRKAFQEILLGNRPKPKSLSEAMASLQVGDSYELTCVASEPLVEDPVAFEWSSDGFLWVAEMRDYPMGLDGAGAPGGRIKRLEDVDGDGVYDESLIFLDQIPFPNGIYPWENGLWISSAPNVFFASDLDGDGKADLVRRLFDGFGVWNQQHLVNGFVYGLDHQLYGANGDSSGIVRSLWSDEEWDIRRRDFRFDPVSGRFERVEGQTQFGRRRDDWGHWFGNNNPNWLWHYHLPERYAGRVSFADLGSNKIQLASEPELKKVNQIAPTLQRFNDIGMRGHVTSACGPSLYRDTVLFDDDKQHVFICEPVHNLVRHLVLEPDGMSFKANRPEDEQQREFFASTDPWFRPSMSKTGPDGALYVSDMYRLIIEHTEWIPDDVEQYMDTRAGTDKGRIYRIHRKGVDNRGMPNMDSMTASEWTVMLENDNGWVRDTAQRLLVSSHAEGQSAVLKTMLRTAVQPKARLHAMWTLHGLGHLSVDDLLAILKDPHEGVRENALQLSEFAAYQRALETEETYASTFSKLLEDPARSVRYQAILTLGAVENEWSGDFLAQAMHRDQRRPYFKEALLTTASVHLEPMLKHAMSCETCLEGPLRNDLLSLAFREKVPWLDHAVRQATRLDQEKSGALQPKAHLPLDPDLSVESLANGYAGKTGVTDQSLSGKISLLTQFAKSGGSVKEADGWPVREMTELMIPVLLDAQASTGQRILAFDFMFALGGVQDWVPWLEYLFAGQSGLGTETKRHILNQISNRPESLGENSGWLESLWNRCSLEERRILLGIVLKRESWTKRFLNVLATGHFESGEQPLVDATITPEMTIALRNLPNAALKPIVKEALDQRSHRLGLNRVPDQTVQQRFEKIAKLSRNTRHGQELFKQNCSVCHLFGGEGASVGPDLNALSDRSGLALLTAILNPNDAIEQTYLAHELVLKDETEWTVLLGEQTADSIAITTTTGEKRSIPNDQVESLRPATRSLMPEGWGEALSDQDLADLIAYLQMQSL